MSAALLVVHEKCNRPAAEDEWVHWHVEQHHDDLLATGASHVTFWQLARKPEPGMPGLGFSHVTIVEQDQAAVPDFARVLADLRGRGRLHPTHTVIDAQSYVTHGPWNDKPAPDESLRGHILAHVMANDPGREAEWDAWYDADHIPDMMASGAFSAATRWQRSPRQALGPNHITLYDVTHESVDTAVEMSAAVMPGLIAAGRKHPTHTGALTVTLVRAVTR